MSTKTFRLLLTATWLVSLVSIPIHLVTFHSMPPDIQSFVHSQSVLTPRNIIGLVAGLIALAAVVVGYVGMYTWRWWGRTLYLFAIVINVVTIPVSTSPVILSSLVASLYTLSYILTGVIIGVAYFNPSISERFAKPTNAQPQDRQVLSESAPSASSDKPSS